MQPTGLVILDGWGECSSTEYNAISQANTPNFDFLKQNYPHCSLNASGQPIGLPDKQVGNSEVGHLSIGAGRIIQQNLNTINQSAEGQFIDNCVIINAIKEATNTIHIIGLLSAAGVHSNENHIFNLLKAIYNKTDNPCYLHIITDGRDTSIHASLTSIKHLKQLLSSMPNFFIASVCGRFFAMDRDNRWQRTKEYYQLLLDAQGLQVEEGSLLETIKQLHDKGTSDEFIPPIFLTSGRVVATEDSVFLMNFRVDRMRQITEALCVDKFSHFSRVVKIDKVVSLTNYRDDFPVEVAFQTEKITNSFGEWVAHKGLKQLRIAETEKYPHVTFFFNGGENIQYKNEERILVPSPKVRTYNLQPSMSALNVTNQLIDRLGKGNLDTFILNFANPDMVGHCGDMQATINAVECVDEQLGRIIKVAKGMNWNLVVTADHGNADCMFDEATNLPHTAHTLSKVPLIVFSDRKIQLKQRGSICQVAPTLLNLMQVPIPVEMTLPSLIVSAQDNEI